MADAERCISCGAVIPEGRMTCPACDMRAKLEYENALYCGRDDLRAGMKDGGACEDTAYEQA